MHADGFDQPGFCEPFPHEERHCRDQRADEQQRAVARQHLLAVRRRVVQAKGRQPEGEREKQTADDVHLLRILGLALRRQAEVDHHHGDERERHIDPEDRLPMVEHPDHRDAVHRADDAAEFLGGADAAEHRRAVTACPQVGGERQGDRQQGAAGDALDEPADDEDVEVGGHRRDHRADGETGKAGLQQQFSAEPVRRPAQQRHRGDVSQQIPR